MTEEVSGAGSGYNLEENALQTSTKLFQVAAGGKETKMEGGCFCGFVRYSAAGSQRDETNCHCSICRRTSAAAFVTWFTVAVNDFRFTTGEPTRFQSSAHGTRTFCPRCGTPLTFQSSQAAEEIDVTTCSLDDPERVPPKDHTRVSSRLSWVALGDLPAFLEGRSSLKI